MLLSIVVPSCGRKELIDTIDSCLAQQLPPGAEIEVVVVDNTRDGRIRSSLPCRGERVRWVHEPAPGVSQARNAGVAAARGDFIAFVDDDERAKDGWACAMLKQADAGARAAFGPVLPDFEMQPGPLMGAALRIYRRQLDMPDGADITGHYAHLGTGNSMFHRSCFDSAEPFLVELGKFGGEDSAFIRSLVRRGIRLAWASEAVVAEHVPATRLTWSSIAVRRFRQGQIRSLVRFTPPGSTRIEGLGWMIVGLGQACIYGPIALSLAPFDKNRARLLALDAIAGLGKCFWQSPFWRRNYG